MKDNLDVVIKTLEESLPDMFKDELNLLKTIEAMQTRIAAWEAQVIGLNSLSWRWAADRSWGMTGSGSPSGHTGAQVYQAAPGLQAFQGGAGVPGSGSTPSV